MHLENLRDALRVFRESEPYSFLHEDDLDAQQYRITVIIRDTPDVIPLIVGDLFCCLRSSLDQLVYSLAHLRSRESRNNQFPILAAENTAEFERRTKGIPAEAAAIVRSLQPYHGGDTTAIRGNLLWKLNAICNIDKHRRIPVHGTGMLFRFPNVSVDVRRLINFDNDNGVISVPISLKSKMALDPEISLDVAFGDLREGVQCSLAGIEEIYEFVTSDVLPRFARFFVD
jgi:hypothetical protein